MGYLGDSGFPADLPLSYPWTSAAQNDAVNWGFSLTPFARPSAVDHLFSQWVHSPSHLANLLGPYSSFGVGYARSPSGFSYGVEIFTTP